MLGLAVALTILVNVLMLQRRFRPLERLVDEMERADLSRPGANLKAPQAGGPEEVQRLQKAFRRMLERLEAERRRVSSIALHAQEEERARVARDLHDEVNQSLTGLLLRLEALRYRAPRRARGRPGRDQVPRQPGDDRAADPGAVAAPDGARRPRPAGGALGPGRRPRPPEQDRHRSSTPATSSRGVPMDVQLVAYRVAQEALSNAAQHSDATRIRVRLGHDRRRDHAQRGRRRQGIQLRRGPQRPGSGRDARAGAAGGRRPVIESRPAEGTRIRLRVPITRSRWQPCWHHRGMKPTAAP